MDFSTIQDFISKFGFPTLVAIWALWRLDKNWGKGENIQARLDAIEDTVDRVEVIVNKNAELQVELLTTFKILQEIVKTSYRRNGSETDR